MFHSIKSSPSGNPQAHQVSSSHTVRQETSSQMCTITTHPKCAEPISEHQTHLYNMSGEVCHLSTWIPRRYTVRILRMVLEFHLLPYILSSATVNHILLQQPDSHRYKFSAKWSNILKQSNRSRTIQRHEQKFVLLVITTATYHKGSTANARQHYIRDSSNQANINKYKHFLV